jgi:WD40 repeat protein
MPTLERQAPAKGRGKRHERRDVFISYSRSDKSFVELLHRRLADSGKKVYVDVRDIPKWSEDWQEELYRQIEASDVVVAVLSKAAVGSPHVAAELDHAAAEGKRLKGLQLTDVVDEQVPTPVRTGQWIDFRDRDAFEDRFADLLEVLNTDVDWVQQHTRFGIDARDWEDRGEDRSLLLGRSDLRDAEEWLASQAGKQPPPTELHSQFILASRRAAAKRRQVLLGAVLVALAVAVGLAIFALLQRSEAIDQRNQAEREARIAGSRELAATAATKLRSDPRLSLLLAIEAARRARTAEAENMLRRALPSSRGRAVFFDEVTVTAFSSDGKLVATGHRDETVRVWDAATGRRVKVLRHPEGLSDVEGVGDVAFSPDGRLLVTVSEDEGTARVWRVGTWRLVTTRTHPDGIAGVAFSLRGGLAVSQTDDYNGTAVVWEAATGRIVRVLRKAHANILTGADFSPDGKLVVTVSEDGTARVWTARTGRALAVLRAPGGTFRRASFSPDGRLVVTMSRGEPGFRRIGDFRVPLGDAVRVWNARTGKQVATLDRGVYIQDARFSPDGRRLVTTEGDMFEVGSWRRLRGLRGHVALINSAAFSDDSQYVITGSEDGTARVWEAGTGRPIVTLRGHEDAVESAAFSPDGKHAVTVSRDFSAGLWDVPVGSRVVMRGLAAMESSPDGSLLLATGRRGTAHVVRTSTGKAIATLTGRVGRLPVAAFSADNSVVALSSSGRPLRIWDARSGRPIGTLSRVGYASEMALSRRGRRIAVRTGFHRASVWDTATEERIVEFRGGESVGGGGLPASFGSVSFDGPARRVVAGMSSTDIDYAEVWSVPTGQTLRMLSGETDADSHTAGVSTARFAPNGSLVVTASADKTARVWSVDTGENVSVLRGHDDHVTDAAFSPNGTFVVTASFDGTARVWDTATGRSLMVFRGHGGGREGYVSGAVFTSDGRSVVTTTAEGSARVFACDACLPVDDLLDLAVERAPRGLTSEERGTYLHE